MDAGERLAPAGAPATPVLQKSVSFLPFPTKRMQGQGYRRSLG